MASPIRGESVDRTNATQCRAALRYNLAVPRSVARGAGANDRWFGESAAFHIKGGKMSKRLLAIALSTAATIGVAHAAPPTFYAGGDISGFTSKIEDKTGIPPNESGS